MGRKVFSVDDAITKNRPKIKLRGEFYYLRDMTVQERLQKTLDMKERQEELEKKLVEEGEEVNFDNLTPVISMAVQEALEGVPDEVAESLTELEWQALQKAINAARGTDIGVVEVEDEDEESERAKGN